VAIAYNNIENFTTNSLNSAQGTHTVNATYNWWGTIDSQAIGVSIHDFKYDLDLAQVNFEPFLTSENPQAMPQDGPDYTTPRANPGITDSPTSAPMTPVPSSRGSTGFNSEDITQIALVILLSVTVAVLILANYIVVLRYKKLN
jgi:hypothetical protein